MNKFLKVLGALGTIYLDSKQEKVKFKITCSNCENEFELSSSSSLDSGEIRIYIKEKYSEYDEDEVIIKCQKCNNDLYSSINTW